MLLSVTDTTITVGCANCRAVRTLDIATLQLGCDFSPDAVELPQCACGAREYLCRTWDSVPATEAAVVGAAMTTAVASGFDEHRRRVNGLAQRLKTDGRTAQKHAKAYAKEKGDPPDMPRAGKAVEALAHV